MTTKGDKVAKLIDALDNGNILIKEFTGEKQFLIKSDNSYEVKGWASALVSAQDCLFEITQYPERWEVFPDFNMNERDYPYPWSSKWEERDEN